MLLVILKVGKDTILMAYQINTEPQQAADNQLHHSTITPQPPLVITKIYIHDDDDCISGLRLRNLYACSTTYIQ